MPNTGFLQGMQLILSGYNGCVVAVLYQQKNMHIHGDFNLDYFALVMWFLYMPAV